MSKTVNPLFMMIPCVCATQGGDRLCAYLRSRAENSVY